VAGVSFDRQRLSADLVQAGTGDRAAFHRVYRATSAKLLGICFRVTGERMAAEDVLQEVYVIIWRHAARYDPDRASPITWLCMIARNRAIDWKRAHDRIGDRFGTMMPPFVADERVPIDQALMSLEMEHAALQCLEQLSSDQRSVIRDAFLDGHTYLKLAERLSLPLGTVKSRIRRGLLELKKCLSHD
jgi:RNA polymerase sigma factor (sigma-70 family)